VSDLVFVTLSTFAVHDREPMRLLETSGVPFRVNGTGKRITTIELLEAGRDASVIIAGVEPYDAATLQALPALRCISRCGVGVDSIDLVAARACGISVLNTPDPPTAAVAELAVTMMLALCRQLPRQVLHARRGEWMRLDSRLLGGRRVGLIGLGRIGRRVASLLQPFGCEIRATDPGVAAGAVPGVALVPLPELIRACDIISIHAARDAASPLVLGAAEIAAMPPGAILINVARGGMVDERALHDALVSGHLAGAGLDAYEHEPYDGPLCELDNVILTPHSATLTVETRAAMEIECVQNALAFVRGRVASLDHRLV
jgi:D-3-phosphoglycerate dehydrogenase / 2-oxoglutarate reductase